MKTTRSSTRHISSVLLGLLPEAVVLHLLALAEASTLARVACTSRALAVLVPVAIEQRAKLLGQRLMPRAGEATRLLSLRFAERLVARPAVTLAGDTCHTLCIDCDGRAWAWGGHELGPVADEEHDVEPDADEQDSAAGQRKWLLHLGLGRDAGPDVLRPERVALEPSAGLRVLDVAAGYEHSLLRCADGFVYSFGVGAHGRLGHGLASTATPRRVEAIEHVAQVAAGGFQSLAVTDSGHAYSWGWGESGSTGHGERHHHVVPKLITALAHLRIVQASAGSGHSLFLSDAGVVFACGDHRLGKLGLGRGDAVADVLTPTAVTFPPGVRVAQCSAWHAHSLAVCEEGRLYSFGAGAKGRLGLGDERNRWRPALVRHFHKGRRVLSAAAAELHTCVLTRSGEVFAFGDCTRGQTGVVRDAPQLTPRRVRVHGAVAELAVGDHHTLLRVADDRRLLTFGKNTEGQLGLGARGQGKACVARPSPVSWEAEGARAGRERNHPEHDEEAHDDDDTGLPGDGPFGGLELPPPLLAVADDEDNALDDALMQQLL